MMFEFDVFFDVYTFRLAHCSAAVAKEILNSCHSDLYCLAASHGKVNASCVLLIFGFSLSSSSFWVTSLIGSEAFKTPGKWILFSRCLCLCVSFTFGHCNSQHVSYLSIYRSVGGNRSQMCTDAAINI